MNSNRIPTATAVLDELGSEFTAAIIDSVAGARADFHDLRDWRADWFSSYSSRFKANFIHERMWDRMTTILDPVDTVTAVDKEPTRQFTIGTKYVIRLKRHSIDQHIAAYPTEAGEDFWDSSIPTLDGFESFSLAAGYIWDDKEGEIGQAIISFRDSLHSKPRWAEILERGEAGATPIVHRPVGPTLPSMDLSAVIIEAERTSEG